MIDTTLFLQHSTLNYNLKYKSVENYVDHYLTGLKQKNIEPFKMFCGVFSHAWFSIK